MFDALYEYEFLARPVQLRPNTAAAMPEVVGRLQDLHDPHPPGIYFADDPAFKGKRRELTAADYVYSIKRHFDPRWKSPTATPRSTTTGIVGLDDAAQGARCATRSRSTTTAPVEGLRALDRYTIAVQARASRTRASPTSSRDPALTGAVAREVVEAYGDKIMEHPVGTGPYRLGEWRRSSLIVFEKNPNYRDVLLRRGGAAPTTPLAQAARRATAGRKLPMIDRVEVSDHRAAAAALARVREPRDGLHRAGARATSPTPRSRTTSSRRTSPSKASTKCAICATTRRMSYFAWRIRSSAATRPRRSRCAGRSRSAVNVDEEIRVVRRGQAIPAQSIVAPGLWRLRPRRSAARWAASTAPRRKALLDLYGYVDRDGDGWREQPDGSPLVLEYATQPDDLNRQLIDAVEEEHGRDRRRGSSSRPRSGRRT